MDDNNTLEFSIQARILPQIQGAAEFEQQLQSLPGKYQERVGQVIGSQGFEQGLADEQIAQAQDWMKFSKGLYAPFQERIDELLKDFSVDVSGGNLSQAQMRKYQRKLERLKVDMGDFSPEVMDDARDFMNTLDPDRLTMISGALKQARGDIENDIDAIKDKFVTLGNAINDGNKNAQSFFNELKQAGIFAIGGMVATEGMRWIKTEAEIGARERTAFDLTSPVGMYSERRQYEVFESTRERERLYSTIGMALGSALGSFFGPLGILGGGIFGSQMGGMVANIFNLKEQSETEEELKLLNQSYGTISGFVAGSQNYDILRARLRARFGSGAIGMTGLGYTPEQEMSMRIGFGDNLGRWDEDLYKEQTTFARAIGLDPSQIYALNLSSRITGQDVGIAGLNQARTFTQSIFGGDVSPSRIAEVLNEIKTINEQMLRLNINADSRDALRFAHLPTDIFGTESPYGRLGDLGGTTLKMLENLMMPKTGAQNAFLYQALGTDNLVDFTESMKGGIYSGDNLVNIIEQLRKTTGQDKYLSYFMLNEMMPNAPQGFIPGMVDIITNDEKYKDLISKFKEHEDQLKNSTKTEKEKEEETKEFMKKYGLLADSAVSQTEKMLEEVQTKQNEVADIWRKTVQDASKRMADFWETMGKNSKLQEEIIGKVEQGMQLLRNWMGEKGLLPEDQQKLFNYEKKKISDEEEERIKAIGGPMNLVSPGLAPTTNNNGFTKFLEGIFGSNTSDYGTEKKDSSWWHEFYNKVHNELLRTKIGQRYSMNLLQGYDRDGEGHMPGSAHYSGDAFDFTIFDRETGKRISKEQYPKALVDALSKIAEHLGIEYGGAYRNPDNNHFEKGGKAPVIIEFHNLNYEDANKISNMEIIARPNFGVANF